MQTGDQWIEPLCGNRSRIRDRYNELALVFRERYTVTFRVYDEGMGYRISTDLRDSIYIAGEQAEFNFSDDYSMWAAHSSSGTFEHSYESRYTCRSISALWDTIITLPALIDANNVKVLVTEAGHQEYPRFPPEKVKA